MTGSDVELLLLLLREVRYDLHEVRELLEWQKDCMSTSEEKQNAAAREMFEEMIQRTRQEYAQAREQQRLEHEMLYHHKGPVANG